MTPLFTANNLNKKYMVMADKPSQPYHLNVQFRGHVEGLTYLDEESRPLCHFFGGVPYALPPVGSFRFQRPRSLPSCYRYGTKVNPGKYVGGCGLCPQPRFTEDLDDNQWDEDCLQSNIWIPLGTPPAGGWPVLFYIHGGFLQYGSPNLLDLRSLLSTSPLRCIVVAPAYRLNILGFLSLPTAESSSNLQSNILNLQDRNTDRNTTASSPIAPTANFGFHDQRLALQWTHENISYFSGNPSNMTIAGYSAGSHSVFHQLAYDLGLPDSKALVKRAIMWSNGSGMQPKSLSEGHEQYLELLDALKIDKMQSPNEQVQQLRAMPVKRLLGAIWHVKLHQFRAITDGAFVRHQLLGELSTGGFARTMRRRSVHMITGECSNEHMLYSQWRTPSPGYTSLQARLEADYPQAAVRTILSHYFPSPTSRELPAAYRDWQHLFGRIYANIQIHALMRGNVHALCSSGAAHLVHRYRVEWRAKCVDEFLPETAGVTHTSDLPIWFWGNGYKISAEEKSIIDRSFMGPLGKFVEGDMRGFEEGWGVKGAREVRTLKEDGSVVVEEDKEMEEGLDMWEKLKRGGFTGDLEKEARL